METDMTARRFAVALPVCLALIAPFAHAGPQTQGSLEGLTDVAGKSAIAGRKCTYQRRERQHSACFGFTRSALRTNDAHAPRPW